MIGVGTAPAVVGERQQEADRPDRGPVTRTPEPGPQRARRAARALGGWLRSAPLTLVLLAGLWALGAATGSLAHGPSERLLDRVGVGLPTLAEGRWWTPFTSLFWCSGAGSYVFTSLLLLLVGPAAEHRLGRVRTLAVLVGGQLAGTLLGAGLIAVGSRVGEQWTASVADQTAVGPAIGLFTLAGVLGYRLTVLWRRRLHLLVLLVPLVMTLYVGHLQSVQRCAAALVGLGVGALLGRGRLRLRTHRSSHSETRVLVAVCLVAAALGPLIASLYDNASGPFNTFSELYFSHRLSPDEVADLCAVSAHDCARAHAVERIFDTPGRLMAAVFPALLLVLAEGLRRGLRLAWRVTIATELLWAGLLCWLYLGSGPVGGDAVQYFVEALLLPLLTIGLLLANRQRFRLRLSGRSVRRLAALTGGAALAASAAYTGLGVLAADQFEPGATFRRLLHGLPAQFLPPAYNDLTPDYPIAVGPVALLLETYCGLAFWVVALSALLLAFRRPVVHTDAAAAARARALLTAHGGGTLSFITTWDGNHYWFDEEGRAAVAYRVLGTVALTTGDPFGAPEARAGAVAGFARYCDARGWTPCLYSVSPQTRAAAGQLGWRSVQVAEDTVVALPELAFTGRKWQDIRTALNKAGKQGITAEWWAYHEAPLALRDQIRAISEEWVSEKGLPEMGFTLGGLEELDDPDVRVLIAVDEQRVVHGLTSWMPVYEDGVPVGWTLDFMRRRSDGFRGVNEFLIASAALGFKEEGARFLSLSGAPLARSGQDEGPTGLQRMLDWMGRVLEPVYGFRSLLAFKAKFQPEYRPMYMAYPDPAALPSITRAIGKAYLPHLTPAQGVRLMRRLSG
ncbi:phosphatidylglycerol lysyltransferase [Kitasatospora sp. MAA19]|uniref:rhomboid family intramembrane serine protease n=1 Tax=Kitasatospora sp. MAA19 TaxID=3035090 RepID=UPI0024749D77|nr:rhomboid family intramembrane serine protease [Kitasatospora sp. MAA19]MDH6707138.1 phosphatidylglycerol lysyltransferase [Kitasatospora sp. MAA19]